MTYKERRIQTAKVKAWETAYNALYKVAEQLASYEVRENGAEQEAWTWIRNDFHQTLVEAVLKEKPEHPPLKLGLNIVEKQ